MGLLAAAAVMGAAAAAAFGGFGFGREDALTDQQVAVREATFADAGPVILPMVPATEREQAIAVLGLPADQAAELQRDTAAGEVQLVYLTLWDDIEEDGDVIRIEAGAFTQDVTLQHTPTRLTIPLARDGRLIILGVRDGGGGITVGVASGNRTVPLPRLRTGQAIPIPVR
jgi:hypothetical protein